MIMPVYRTHWKHYEWKKSWYTAHTKIFTFLFSIAFSNPYTCFWLGLTYLMGLLWGARVIKSFKNDKDLEIVMKVEFPQKQQSLIFTSEWVILLGVVISLVDGLQVHYNQTFLIAFTFVQLKGKVCIILNL